MAWRDWNWTAISVLVAVVGTGVAVNQCTETAIDNSEARLEKRIEAVRTDLQAYQHNHHARELEVEGRLVRLDGRLARLEAVKGTEQ